MRERHHPAKSPPSVPSDVPAHASDADTGRAWGAFAQAVLALSVGPCRCKPLLTTAESPLARAHRHTPTGLGGYAPHTAKAIRWVRLALRPDRRATRDLSALATATVPVVADRPIPPGTTTKTACVTGPYPPDVSGESDVGSAPHCQRVATQTRPAGGAAHRRPGQAHRSRARSRAARAVPALAHLHLQASAGPPCQGCRGRVCPRHERRVHLYDTMLSAMAGPPQPAMEYVSLPSRVPRCQP
jgi:hypothetical protein